MAKSDDEAHEDGKPNYPAMTGEGKAGWTDILKDHVKTYPKETTFALATLSEDGLPRNRFVIYRATSPASSFLIITTDIRMPKASQLARNSSVEIAWWQSEPNVQFRVIGKAFIIPDGVSNNPDDVKKLEGVLKELGAQGDELSVGWWEKERERIWKEGISDYLRGTFGRPPSGTRLEDNEEKPKDWPVKIPAEAEDEQKETVEFAKSNFTLVAIAPTSFDFVELAAKPNKRNNWTRQSDGTWAVEGLVP